MVWLEKLRRMAYPQIILFPFRYQNWNNHVAVLSRKHWLMKNASSRKLFELICNNIPMSFKIKPMFSGEQKFQPYIVYNLFLFVKIKCEDHFHKYLNICPFHPGCHQGLAWILVFFTESKLSKNLLIPKTIYVIVFSWVVTMKKKTNL
jgi:hypothetical protein